MYHNSHTALLSMPVVYATYSYNGAFDTPTQCSAKIMRFGNALVVVLVPVFSKGLLNIIVLAI